MALTRSMLKAMGIEEEKIEQIIESHTESTNALKDQRDEAMRQAERVTELEKQVEELSAQPQDDWRAKYDEEHESFEAFKAEVAKQRELDEKRSLYGALLKDSGVDERRIPAILKVTDLDGISVRDGAIEGAEALSARVAEEWGDFIAQTFVKGAKVDDPPAQDHTEFEGMTLAEKMRYANENPGDPAVAEWLRG